MPCCELWHSNRYFWTQVASSQHKCARELLCLCVFLCDLTCHLDVLCHPLERKAPALCIDRILILWRLFLSVQVWVAVT